LDYTSADFARAKPLHANIGVDMNQALAEFQNLNKALAEKLEDRTPALDRLEEALQDCQRWVKHLVGEPEAEASPDAAASNGMAGNQPTALTGRVPVSREEAYRQLAQIAGVLEQLEPHSPIPDLLRRAVELGKMPFRQLIREIVRDHGMLTELNREFGIKEPTPPSE
jgi:type VI secretion system protein ImpA